MGRKIRRSELLSFSPRRPLAVSFFPRTPNSHHAQPTAQPWATIIVAAAAGLRLGWALVNPGTQTRRDSLVAAARPAVLMTIGVVPWLGVAGIIEAFVSRRGLAALPMSIVGLIVGGLFWFLMWARSAKRRPAA